MFKQKGTSCLQSSKHWRLLTKDILPVLAKLKHIYWYLTLFQKSVLLDITLLWTIDTSGMCQIALLLLLLFTGIGMWLGRRESVLLTGDKTCDLRLVNIIHFNQHCECQRHYFHSMEHRVLQNVFFVLFICFLWKCFWNLNLSEA